MDCLWIDRDLWECIFDDYFRWGKWHIAVFLLDCWPINCYNRYSPSGGMIFLNNHVIGISWQVSVETTHKILPTLYLLRGKYGH